MKSNELKDEIEINLKKVENGEALTIPLVVLNGEFKKKFGEFEKLKERDYSYLNGEKHWNWQNGKSFEPYSLDFNKKLKELIKERDNFQCQYYGGTHKGNLTVHHINYNKKDCRPENLITLCRRHNIMANKNKEYWKNYFQKN